MRLNASRAHSPAPTPDTPLKGRICACGCGEVFTARRWWQEFKDTSHRKANWNRCRRTENRMATFEVRLRVVEKRLGITKGD